MKLWIAVVGIVKEGLEPVGVFSTYEAARRVAEREHNPEFQDFDVLEFELDAMPPKSVEREPGDG